MPGLIAEFVLENSLELIRNIHLEESEYTVLMKALVLKNVY